MSDYSGYFLPEVLPENVKLTFPELEKIFKETGAMVRIGDPSYSEENQINFGGIVRSYNEQGELMFGAYFTQTFNLPKKKIIDVPYMMEKINKKLASLGEYNYENMRPVFEKVAISGHIYYTSFGLSYDCLFRNKTKQEADIKAIKEKLDALGIKYTNEYSDARWVYRFRISKSAENLTKIKNL